MGKHEKVKSDFLVQYYLQELKLKSLEWLSIITFKCHCYRFRGDNSPARAFVLALIYDYDVDLL